MQENSSGKGLKRQVSPLWATVFVLLVIAATILVGVIWPLSHATVILDPNQKQVLEYQECRSTVSHCLGVNVSMRRDAKPGVMVLGPPSRDPKNLQQGDVITAINGTPVSSVKALATQVDRMLVGELIEVDIKRREQPLKIQVCRQERRLNLH